MIRPEALRRWQRPLEPCYPAVSFALPHTLQKGGRLGRFLVGVTCLLVVAACAEVELVSHAAKQVQPASRTHGEGQYKIGNPYQIDGVWYYPRIDYDYRETGIASWYGPNFHGNLTANGEVYNQYELTAAHRTLPMPSMVRVTNLENGRSIAVRVNDRGPFKNGRIIDLSTRAAQLLGFQKVGTAKVMVEVLEPESRKLASVAQSREAAGMAPEAVPVVAVQSSPIDGVTNGSQSAIPAPMPVAVADAQSDARPPLIEPEPDGRVTRQPVRATNIYVQAGAFVLRENALRLGARLSIFGPTSITESLKGQQRFYRVRLGPVDSVDDADRLLATLLENGHKDARVVVD
jgi:peptidoglycan lytic transglycosylase